MKPPVEDDVLDPVDDEDIAVRVLVGDVAGVQVHPDQRIRGLGGLAEVTAHHLRATHARLPALALRDRGLAVYQGDDVERGERQRQAD